MVRVMFSMVVECNAKTVVEFGTRDGFSTRLFSKALEDKGTITSVDMNKCGPFEEKNIILVQSSVEDFTLTTPCDILYIDDWHDGFHLYYELNRFAHMAKTVMIHDICQDVELLHAVTEWCRDNWVIYTVYPLNGCGLAVLEIEKSKSFYTLEDKTTSK